jgi:hypothetical protein
MGDIHSYKTMEGSRLFPPSGSVVARRATSVTTTSVLERLLLVLIIVVLPLENHIRKVPGYSILFFLFGIVAIYVVLNRPWALKRAICHPVFRAAFGFLGLSLAIEYTHPYSDTSEILRIGQMILGGIVVASICRDLASLQAALLGYVVAGIWVSVVLFLTSYGALQAGNPMDFNEASLLRVEAFMENPVQGNLNGMAFVAAQGTVVAFASALTARSVLLRSFLMSAGLFCLVATFLPMSRSGVVIAIVSCASVLYAFGLRRGKAMLLAALIVGAIFMWVPESVWTRMSFSTETYDGKMEGRALVYMAAIEHFPEYAITGVGAGNFWSSWGPRSRFAGGDGMLSGSHNCFFQVTLYWGVGALVVLLSVLWQAYRNLPRHCNREPESLCLVGISVSLLLLSLVVHNVYAKEFSLGLGMLVGARCWIWPIGVVQSVKRQDALSPSSLLSIRA